MKTVVNTVVHPRPPEFKQGQAGRLVVTIQKVAGSWDIEPSNAAQRARINNRINVDLTAADSHKLESIDDEYTLRKTLAAPVQLHFRRDPTHVPILLREGEDVEFRCVPPYAFAIYMGRDPDVNLETRPQFGQGPDNLFGWTGTQFAAANTSIQATVDGPVNSNGPADQRFYKVKAWIWENGPNVDPTVVDPDGICDR